MIKVNGNFATGNITMDGVYYCRIYGMSPVDFLETVSLLARLRNKDVEPKPLDLKKLRRAVAESGLTDTDIEELIKNCERKK